MQLDVHVNRDFLFPKSVGKSNVMVKLFVEFTRVQ